jgi:DNA-binding transcriptional regulator YiaG
VLSSRRTVRVDFELWAGQMAFACATFRRLRLNLLFGVGNISTFLE